MSVVTPPDADAIISAAPVSSAATPVNTESAEVEAEAAADRRTPVDMVPTADDVADVYPPKLGPADSTEDVELCAVAVLARRTCVVTAADIVAVAEATPARRVAVVSIPTVDVAADDAATS